MLATRPLLLFLAAAIVLSADTQHEVMRDGPRALLEDLPAVNQAAASLANPEAAHDVLVTLLPKAFTLPKTDSAKKDTAETVPISQKDIEGKDFYCIMHIVRWKQDKDGKDVVDKQNWYLYHQQSGWKQPGNWTQENFHQLNRIYGARSIWVFYLYLNKIENAFQPSYELDITGKTPAYLDHLFLVFRAFGGTSGLPAQAATKQYWGAQQIRIDHVPSDITLTPNLYRMDNSALAGDPIALDKAQKYDNEGRYFLDFSAGVPIRKISQLTFSETGNTITPAKVDKRDVLALLDLYPRPVDVKNTSYSRWPYLVTGVAIASQPLHKVLVGAGYGPFFAQFYIGAMFVTETTVIGQGAAATTHKRTSPQLAFGINIPIGGVVETAKKK